VHRMEVDLLENLGDFLRTPPSLSNGFKDPIDQRKGRNGDITDTACTLAV